MAHRVLICGDRHWKNEQVIRDFLALLHPETTCVIQGGAPGADSIAAKLARERGLSVVTHEAEWNRYGRSAEPIRNRKMIADNPELVIGFHDNIFESKETKDMIGVSRLKTIPYMVINSSGVIYQYGFLQDNWIDKLDKSEKLKFKNGMFFEDKT